MIFEVIGMFATWLLGLAFCFYASFYLGGKTVHNEGFAPLAAGLFYGKWAAILYLAVTVGYFIVT